MRRLSILGAILLLFLLSKPSVSMVIEKTVAYVGNDAITLTEACRYWKATKAINPDTTFQEALEALFNRTLILHRAKELNLSADTEDELIDVYIRFTIRPRITITRQEIRQYYFEHYQQLKGTSLERLQEEIAQLLYEKKTNELLKKDLEELRKTLPSKINGPVDEGLCNFQKR